MGEASKEAVEIAVRAYPIAIPPSIDQVKASIHVAAKDIDALREKDRAEDKKRIEELEGLLSAEAGLREGIEKSLSCAIAVREEDRDKLKAENERLREVLGNLLEVAEADQVALDGEFGQCRSAERLYADGDMDEAIVDAKKALTQRGEDE